MAHRQVSLLKQRREEMVTKALSLVLGTWCLASLCVAAGLRSVGDPELGLIWEKTFDNNVTDFAIREKPDGKSYLPVVTTVGDTESAAVHFFDEDMNPTVQICLPAMSLTHITKDGQYVGTFAIQAWAEEGESRGRFTVYDGDGNELWAADSIWKPWSFFILGDGDRLACMYESWGSIVFYDPQGDTIAHLVPWHFKLDEVASPEDTIFGHAAALYADASESGQFVVVNGSPSIPTSREATIFFFSKDGTGLWQKLLSERGTDEIRLSADGGVVAAEAYTVDYSQPSNRAYILSGTGDILRTHDFAIPGSGWSPIALSDGGERFAYAPSADTILCYDTESGDLLWQYVDPDTSTSFTSLAISAGTSPPVLAAASTDSPGPEPDYYLPRYMYLLSGTGELLGKREFSGEGYIGFAGPIVRFAKHDSKQFFAANTNTIGYYFYRP